MMCWRAGDARLSITDQSRYDITNFKKKNTPHSVTAGIDALGEVTVRLEDLSTGKIYYGRSANTDVVVAATQAYLSALNRVAVSRGSLPVHPQFGKI